MRGDLEALHWRRYRDLHLRVRAIEAWISSFGTCSSKASNASIMETIGSAGKAATGIVTIARIAGIALLWVWFALGVVWGWVKPWLLGLLHSSPP